VLFRILSREKMTRDLFAFFHTDFRAKERLLGGSLSNCGYLPMNSKNIFSFFFQLGRMLKQDGRNV